MSAAKLGTPAERVRIEMREPIDRLGRRQWRGRNHDEAVNEAR
ncbi:MAG: hypothetical protein ACOY0T_18240 [Myxococcota bacterium]